MAHHLAKGVNFTVNIRNKMLGALGQFELGLQIDNGLGDSFHGRVRFGQVVQVAHPIRNWVHGFDSSLVIKMHRFAQGHGKK
jgi:hypothetical protein